MSPPDYKAAYNRQKQARALAEELLESRSRELYEVNQSLQYAYNRLKNQEQQIVHQEKLAAIGQLSAGVAHEINNPTAYVKSNISALKGYTESLNRFFSEFDNLMQDFCKSQQGGACSPESLSLMAEVNKLKESCDITYVVTDLMDIVDECKEGISRVESIVKGLKDFSKPDTGTTEIIKLKSCIENTVKLVFNQVKHQMDVHSDIAEDLFVEGSQGALSQVFLNMIINASHAVGDNGWMKIQGKKKGDLAILSFEDNGSGIPFEIKQKIFEPFFTTKGGETGTGLGLSICASIIKSHKGSIEVKSQEGVGTTFTIALPLVKDD